MINQEPQEPTKKIIKEAPPIEEKRREEQVALELASTRRTVNIEMVVAGVILLVIAFIIWWNFPIVDQLFRGRYTPTSRPPLPTPTHRPTRTPTAVLSPTPSPQPSMTPMPRSAHIFADPAKLDPPLPDLLVPPIVLNNDSVTPSPDFSNPVWYPSSRLNLPAAANLANPFHAILAPGSATWMMDVSLAPGYYEIYVLDTLYSSAGALNFHVKNDDKELTPLLGQTAIQYRSSQGGNAQATDLWRDLGVYLLDQPGKLSVSTQWDKRDQFSIVAIDRVLIEPLPDTVQQMVTRLPGYPVRYVVDDLAAKISGAGTMVTVKDALSWKDQFQVAVNPQQDLKVTWESDYLPTGPYEIAVWVPAAHNQTQAIFKVLVNGKEMKGGPLAMKQSDWKGGQWVSLGTWDSTPEGNFAKFEVEMDVKGGTPGDVAIDAVAFMKKP